MKKLLLCYLTTGLLASAATADPARKDVDAAYAKAVQAYGKLEARNVFAYYKSDAEITDLKSHKQTVTDQVATIRPFFQLAKRAQATYLITSFKASGSTAQSTVKFHVELVCEDKRDPKSHKVVVELTNDDSWIKDGDKWVVNKSKVVNQTMTVDGQVPPPASPDNPGILEK
jgi:hypothetical protein